MKLTLTQVCEVLLNIGIPTFLCDRGIPERHDGFALCPHGDNDDYFNHALDDCDRIKINPQPKHLVEDSIQENSDRDSCSDGSKNTRCEGYVAVLEQLADIGWSEQLNMLSKSKVYGHRV